MFGWAVSAIILGTGTCLPEDLSAPQEVHVNIHLTCSAHEELKEWIASLAHNDVSQMSYEEWIESLQEGTRKLLQLLESELKVKQAFWEAHIEGGL